MVTLERIFRRIIPVGHALARRRARLNWATGDDIVQCAEPHTANLRKHANALSGVGCVLHAAALLRGSVDLHAPGRQRSRGTREGGIADCKALKHNRGKATLHECLNALIV